LANPSFASRLESKPVVVFELRLFVWGQDRYKVAPKATAADAETNAGSVTTTPSLRKTQAVTWMPSRRRAVNQRMVAREPVTEKFGPRSTPTRTALATGVGAWATVSAEPAIRPAGRLLMRLQATAMTAPEIQLA
jgi:hypothetical protein